MTLTILAIYETREAVESAADALVNAGVPCAEISVLLPENIHAANVETKLEPKLNTEPAVGATSRGILSGTLGVIAGLGMLAIPGFGPLVGEGTLKAGLAELGIEGAVLVISRIGEAFRRTRELENSQVQRRVQPERHMQPARVRSDFD